MELTADCFSRDAYRRDGLNNRCRRCDSARNIAYYTKNLPARREKKRRAHKAVELPRVCKRCGAKTVMNARHWYCGPCRALALAKRRRRERHKVSAAERGYGAEHQRLRRKWAKEVAKGWVCCARCGGLIPVGAKWDLGHSDYDRSVYTGPEHRACNRATAGRNTQRPASRVW